MAMRFSFTVDVEVERIQGKFATRDEIADAIRSALEDAEHNIDVTSIGPDGDSEYEVVCCDIDEVEQKKGKK